jgi:hypothetical protein
MISPGMCAKVILFLRLPQRELNGWSYFGRVGENHGSLADGERRSNREAILSRPWIDSIEKDAVRSQHV